jgi:hypothetical protein
MESHLAAWALQMAELVQRKTRERTQRHQTAVMNQAQAERLWVAGMDQIVHTFTSLVAALKQTGQFPHLTITTHARSPQGTTTYMRQGVLLTLKGVGQDQQTIECAIDNTPTFRPDLLAPLVRVSILSEGRDRGAPPQEQLRLGVSVQGDVVWQLLNPALLLPAEGNLEDLLTRFLAACLSAE